MKLTNIGLSLLWILGAVWLARSRVGKAAQRGELINSITAIITVAALGAGAVAYLLPEGQASQTIELSGIYAGLVYAVVGLISKVAVRSHSKA
jgi:hypothetical protein